MHEGVRYSLKHEGLFALPHLVMIEVFLDKIMVLSLDLLFQLLYLMILNFKLPPHLCYLLLWIGLCV